MQLVDPDPNIQVSHGYITWYIDAIGKVLNEKYKVEVTNQLYEQLLHYKYPHLTHRCDLVSLTLSSKPKPFSLPPTSDCDLHLNLPEILKSLDTSASPYLQQAQIEEKLFDEQLSTFPQVNGWCRYTCELLASASSISLHVLNMTILSARFYLLENKKVISCSKILYDSSREIIQFLFDEMLPQTSKGELLIEFSFPLHCYWYGMYVINPDYLPKEPEHENEDFEEKTVEMQEQIRQEQHKQMKKSSSRLVATQFESTGARRAFPCWDLPTRKIPYTIRILSIAEMDTCISNAPLNFYRTMSLGKGLQLWEFEPTPPLPTYLVTVVLATKQYYTTLTKSIRVPLYPHSFSPTCPHECWNLCQPTVLSMPSWTFTPAPSSTSTFTSTTSTTSTSTSQMIDLRFLVPKAKVKEGYFALKMATQIFSWLWNYFRVSLPFKKLDTVVLPYLRPGAMENWGCMTFREKELVPANLHLSLCSFEHFHQIVNSGKIWAHEAAHQWMGDLLTGQGWSELWIHESFASFYANKCMDNLFPHFCIWGRFISQDEKMVQEMDWMTWSPHLYQECSLFIKKPYVIQDLPMVPISHTDFTLFKNKCTSLDPYAKNRTVVGWVNFFQTNAHIETVFDSITYTKGAAVLRFMEHLYGEKAFQIAMHYFIHSNLFRFGSFQAFKKIFEHISCPKCTHLESFPFSSLVSQFHPHTSLSWTCCMEVIEPYFLQPGFPILFFEILYVETEPLSTALRQEEEEEGEEEEPRFSPPKWIIQFQVWDKKGEPSTPENQIFNFYVPLFPRPPKETKTSQTPLSSKKNMTIDKNLRQGKMEFSSYSEFIRFLKPNQNGIGYYVTLYNDMGYKLLAELIQQQNPILSSLDKIHLLSDLFFALRRKWVAFPIVAKFLLSYIHETHVLVLWHWFLTLREITSYFRFISTMVSYCRKLCSQFFSLVFIELIPKLENEETKKMCSFLRKRSGNLAWIEIVCFSSSNKRKTTKLKKQKISSPLPPPSPFSSSTLSTSLYSAAHLPNPNLLWFLL